VSPTVKHLLAIQLAARSIDTRATTLTPALPEVAERIHDIVYDLLDVLDEAAQQCAPPQGGPMHDGACHQPINRPR
jgi:hypothetical protein